jgi:hypothetical protein
MSFRIANSFLKFEWISDGLFPRCLIRDLRVTDGQIIGQVHFKYIPVSLQSRPSMSRFNSVLPAHASGLAPGPLSY